MLGSVCKCGSEKGSKLERQSLRRGFRSLDHGIGELSPPFSGVSKADRKPHLQYEARAFGCRSGMAGFVAKKLCPHLLS
jgi:hypothetical protein